MRETLRGDKALRLFWRPEKGSLLAGGRWGEAKIHSS